MRAFAFILVLSISAAENEWNPASTWVFAVGVLNFDVPHLRSWPDTNRADAELIELLKKRGVPESQIVFLKNSEAMKYNVESRFNELLGKTHPGDTLIFYYAGHGKRRDDDYGKPIQFVTFDSYSRWDVSDIVATIDARFQGAHAMLIGDCCYSGALALEASRRSGRIDYTVLASAHKNSRSTGSWAFTRFVIDAFNGSPMLDQNGDKKITFAESAAFGETEMGICERQMSVSFCTQKNEQMILSRVTSEKRPRAGELCEAKDGSYFSRVKILDAKDSKCFVSWSSFDRPGGGTNWIDAAQLRPFNPKAYEKNTRVLILRNQLWHRGSVVDAKFGLHLVHYEGAPDSDDEWVRPDRFRLEN